MYNINLIRERIVPDQRKNVMFSVISASALIYALTILAVVFFSAANFKMIDVYANEIDKMQGDLSAYYPGTSPSHDELDIIVRRIRPDLKEIGGLIDDRTEFTYLWEAVARAVPDGAWLTRVEFKIPAAATRNGKSKRGLFIEGMALASGETAGDEVIREFAIALESDPELARHISEAKFAETGRKRLGGEDVTGFEISCPFK